MNRSQTILQWSQNLISGRGGIEKKGRDFRSVTGLRFGAFRLEEEHWKWPQLANLLYTLFGFSIPFSSLTRPSSSSRWNYIYYFFPALDLTLKFSFQQITEFLLASTVVCCWYWAWKKHKKLERIERVCKLGIYRCTRMFPPESHSPNRPEFLKFWISIECSISALKKYVILR